jgi:hypothetical protein
MGAFGRRQQEVKLGERAIVARVDVVDFRANVPRVGVVGLMRVDGRPPVIDGQGHVDVAAHLGAGREAAGAAKEVSSS